MRPFRPSLFATLAVAGLTAQEPASSWLTDLAAAKAAAKEQKKVILADFTGSDWCGWCKKLKADVFEQQEFQDWASKHVVLLEVDFPRTIQQPEELKRQNEQLKEQFKPEGYPTIVFLDADGKEVGRIGGYVKGGPAAFIAEAEQRMKPAAAEGGAEGGAWSTDYQAALKKAKKEKKAILADFTGSDWCGWCIKLKDEVFSKPEFQAWAAKNVVLLELDFPRKKALSPDLKKQNDKLARDFDVKGYPTIVLINGKGEEIGRLGYEKGGPETWIKSAEKILKKK
jgi:protein disulfide-isomerase